MGGQYGRKLARGPCTPIQNLCRKHLLDDHTWKGRGGWEGMGESRPGLLIYTDDWRREGVTLTLVGALLELLVVGRLQHDVQHLVGELGVRERVRLRVDFSGFGLEG